MTKKIAVLRGINVGGKRKILMKDLKDLCQKMDWKNVKTYIQSGNIIFNHDGDNAKIAQNLQSQILTVFGFIVPVIIIDANKLNTIINKNPFVKNGTSTSCLHYTFLKEKPNTEDIKLIELLNFTPDSFKIIDHSVFIYCAGKYHKSKLTNNFFEKKLNVTTTTRNWKTILKLQELCID